MGLLELTVLKLCLTQLQDRSLVIAVIETADKYVDEREA
jgi:hypothetical protein